MKKLPPEYQKGMEAEERLITLARSLKKGHTWIGKVRKAGKKHDLAGVDVIIWVYTITGGKERVLPVALQVKSSVAGVRRFYRVQARAASTGVIPIVVNTYRSDEVILQDLVRALSKGLFSKGRAERVSEYLKKVRKIGPDVSRVSHGSTTLLRTASPHRLF